MPEGGIGARQRGRGGTPGDRGRITGRGWGDWSSGKWKADTMGNACWGQREAGWENRCEGIVGCTGGTDRPEKDVGSFRNTGQPPPQQERRGPHAHGGAAVRAEAGQPLATLRGQGISVAGSQASARPGASTPRPDSASVRQPRPLSWQQAVARQPALLPPHPSEAAQLLWATQSAGSHARLAHSQFGPRVGARKG